MPEPIENLAERIKQGVDFFNREYFFEAHDTFEELWMEAREAKSRELFHGLVNLATGFYHFRMDNFAGMQSQLQKGLAKLEKLSSPCYGVALAPLLQEVQPFIGLAQTLPALPKIMLQPEAALHEF
ncbi:MAG: DUF309 domain-containing protein [candidate division KSB1 bacterium]